MRTCHRPCSNILPKLKHPYLQLYTIPYLQLFTRRRISMGRCDLQWIVGTAFKTRHQQRQCTTTDVAECVARVNTARCTCPTSHRTSLSDLALSGCVCSSTQRTHLTLRLTVLLRVSVLSTLLAFGDIEIFMN